MHFDEFSTVEGYDSARDCLNDINSMVAKDKDERKKMMMDLQAKLRKAQEQWNKRCQLATAAAPADAKADSKSTEAESKDAKVGHELARMEGKDCAADDKEGPVEGADDLENEMELPVMMFFQPVSMDSMLSQVLSLTEYKTFSLIMRAKVKQKKLLRLVRKKVAKQATACRERRELLGFHEVCDDTTVVAAGSDYADSTATHRYSSDRHIHVDVLLSEFESLVDRICGLTPHHKALAEETRNVLQLSMWRQLVLGEDADSGAKGSDDSEQSLQQKKVLFQKLIMNTAMCLWRVCSFEQQFVIRSQINMMMPRIAAIKDDDPDLPNTMHRAEALYLCMSHEIIDDIEKQTLKALEEYETQHEQRRAALRASHHHK